MIVGFIIIFAMAMEGFWEIYEWLFDTFLGTNLQHGLDDTMLDMISSSSGSHRCTHRGTSEFSKELIKAGPKEPRTSDGRTSPGREPLAAIYR